MNSPFFAMQNVHSNNCGEPPTFRNGAAKYHGYFENFFGEQWVFVYDHETKTAKLFGGDAGWQNGYLVSDGRAHGLVLGRAELLWLDACWAAATGRG
jgi:hypothetical protein